MLSSLRNSAWSFFHNGLIVLHSHIRCVTDCFLPSATVGYVFTGVCLSTGGGVHPQAGGRHLPHLGRHPPQADTPWQKPPSPSDGHCILLECILVATKVTLVSGGSRIFLRKGRQLPKWDYFANLLPKTA